MNLENLSLKTTINIGFVKEKSYYSIKRLKNKDLLLFATKLIKK